MKYWLIFALFEKNWDPGGKRYDDKFIIDFIIEYDGLPSMAHLRDLADKRAFSTLIGITGMTELSKEDYESYLLNEQ